MISEINPIYLDPVFNHTGEYIPEFDLTYYDDIPPKEIRSIENVRVRSWWEDVKKNLVVEHEDVVESFNILSATLKEYMSLNDISFVENAYRYTYFCHNYRSIDPKDRMRKNGVNHFTTHPIEVARILAVHKLQKETIVSALLHDVREDTYSTSEEIYGLFGQRIGQNVEDVTKIQRSNKQETEALQLYRLYLCVKDIDQEGNPEAVVVKLADKLHNMQTLDGISDKKRRKEIAHDAYRVYVPLAEKLGLGEIAEELRYLSLKYSEKKTGQAKKRQEEWNSRLESHAFIRFIKSQRPELNNKKFQVHVEKATLNEFFGDKRDPFKTPTHAQLVFSYDTPEERDYWLDIIQHSFIKKTRPNRLSQGHWEFEEIPFGDINWNIRMLSTKKYELEKLSLLDRYKYIENPEQKRLLLREKLSDIRSIISKYEDDPDEFVNIVTERLPHDQIIVFTPKGEQILLNEGSTAADFAYEIHKDFLPFAFGVRINNNESIQPITTKVFAGDKVEIEIEPTWEFIDANLLVNEGITNPSAIRAYKDVLITLIDRKKSEEHYYRALEQSGLGSTYLEKKGSQEESKIKKRALKQLSAIYKEHFDKEPEYDFAEMWSFATHNLRTKFGSWNDFLFSLILRDTQPRFIKNFLEGCKEYEKTHFDSKTLFVINQDGVIADFSTALEEAKTGIIQFNREVNNANVPENATAVRILVDPKEAGKDRVKRIIDRLQKKYDPFTKKPKQTHLSGFENTHVPQTPFHKKTLREVWSFPGQQSWEYPPLIP